MQKRKFREGFRPKINGAKAAEAGESGGVFIFNFWFYSQFSSVLH
jgi:hypothetical protein